MVRPSASISSGFNRISSLAGMASLSEYSYECLSCFGKPRSLSVAKIV
jgi:hypothetical protein